MNIKMPVPEFLVNLYDYAQKRADNKFPAVVGGYEGGFEDGYDRGFFEAVKSIIEQWEREVIEYE